MFIKITSKLTHSSRLAVLLLACIIAIAPMSGFTAISDDLPDIGSAAGTVLTPGEEKRLGKAFMGYIMSTQAVVTDALMDDYINQIGRELVSNSEGRSSHFKFFLIDSPDINAFAGPYGYIGVNTGLITTTDTESELAAVLAHEIAHVNQRHLFRAWHASSSTTLIQAAILLATVALGAAAGGEAAIAAASIGQAAILQNQINFTRANEKEADRIGIRILAESGYEPRAMPSFFTRMGRANRTASTRPPEFLLTHPVSTARTSDSLGRAEKYPHRQPTGDLRYQLTRAAIKQQNFSRSEEAVDYFSKTLADGRYQRKEADQYAYTLALLRNRQLDAARAQVGELLQTHPQTLEFILVRARIEAEAGDLRKGITMLEKALPNFPLSYPMLLDLSSLYLRSKQPLKAYNILNKLAFQKAGDVRIYELLARASAEIGDPIKSHEYLSLYYYYSGALKQAQLQLEIALREKHIDYYDAARIESRLKSIRAEIAALEKEKKH